MILPLFDSTRPAAIEPNVNSEPQPLVPEVLRVIERQRGAFRRVVEGTVTYEYWIVELAESSRIGLPFSPGTE